MILIFRSVLSGDVLLIRVIKTLHVQSGLEFFSPSWAITSFILKMSTQPHTEGIEMVGLKAEKNVTIRDRVVAFFCSPYLFIRELTQTFGLRFIVCHSPTFPSFLSLLIHIDFAFHHSTCWKRLHAGMDEDARLLFISRPQSKSFKDATITSIFSFTVTFIF